MERVLTEAELVLAQAKKARLSEYIAGRFAAKEAVSKAFGCGIGKQLGFLDIELKPDAAGKPHCTVSPAALDRLGLQQMAIRIHISISHSESAAVACCVVETDG
jgi:holo-[acyl-carrier protein] synthase